MSGEITGSLTPSPSIVLRQPAPWWILDFHYPTRDVETTEDLWRMTEVPPLPTRPVSTATLDGRSQRLCEIPQQRPLLRGQMRALYQVFPPMVSRKEPAVQNVRATRQMWRGLRSPWSALELRFPL